jgi:hypothetical protein
MSLNKNNLLLLLLGLLLVLSVEASRPAPWCIPGCKVYSRDGCSCLCCSYGWFKNSYGYCEKVSALCKSWNPFTGICTCCIHGYKLINGKCCKVVVKAPKYWPKEPSFHKPQTFNDYHPTYYHPSFDKPNFFPKSQGPYFNNFKPNNIVSGGWYDKP